MLVRCWIYFIRGLLSNTEGYIEEAEKDDKCVFTCLPRSMSFQFLSIFNYELHLDVMAARRWECALCDIGIPPVLRQRASERRASSAAGVPLRPSRNVKHRRTDGRAEEGRDGYYKSLRTCNNHSSSPTHSLPLSPTRHSVSHRT